MNCAPAKAFVEPSHVVKLYEVTPVRGTTATWLKRILEPVVASCRFETPPPLELRPTGRFAGFTTSDATLNPDRRVSISNKARLWSAVGITHTVLHEWAHILTPGHGHDPVFFSLNLALLMRLDRAGPPEASGLAHRYSMSAYDLQDTPPQLQDLPDRGLGRSISWAWTQARELAPTRLSAEAIANELGGRYESWKVELDAAPANRAVAQRKQSQLQQELKMLRDQVAAYGRTHRLFIWVLSGAAAATLATAFSVLSVVLRMQGQ